MYFSVILERILALAYQKLVKMDWNYEESKKLIKYCFLQRFSQIQ